MRTFYIILLATATITSFASANDASDKKTQARLAIMKLMNIILAPNKLPEENNEGGGLTNTNACPANSVRIETGGTIHCVTSPPLNFDY